MRWIVYLLGLCLTIGGLGVIGLSIDLQGIERGTTLAISGTVALVGGILTLALGAVIGKIESLTAALAPVPAIPPLNLPPYPPEADAPAREQAPGVMPAAPLDPAPRPGPSAGSIGGAAGAAALAASAYAYREMQSEPEERITAQPEPAPEAPILRPSLSPNFADEPTAPAQEPIHQPAHEPTHEPIHEPTHEPAPDDAPAAQPGEPAPTVSLKPLEIEEERAGIAAEPVEAEAPASDREALMEAAIRHDAEPQVEAAPVKEAPVEEAVLEDIRAGRASAEEARDVPATMGDWEDVDYRPVAEASADAAEQGAGSEGVVAQENAQDIAAIAPDEALADQAPDSAGEQPGPAPHDLAEPAAPVGEAAPAAPDPLAWLDRTLSESPAPPERAAPPPPPPPKPAPTVVGRYTSGGVNYTMYSDGSIEAETPTETLRFASMRELKAFIERRSSGEA